MDENRKAGDYTIRQSITIGSKEFVLGEDLNNKDGNFYMLANYDEIFDVIGTYENVLVGKDYLELVEKLTERISDEISRIKAERKGYDPSIITSDMCNFDDYTKNIVGKVIVIKPEKLRPEYANELYQIILATHGFGTAANSRGTKIFGRNLFNGENTLTRRPNIIGELKPEHYPEWLKNNIKENPMLLKINKDKEVER